MSVPVERVVKILFLGDAATGKTSIIKQYVYSDFSEQHIATATVDFTLKLVKKGDITYRMQLWDIAGQDRFQNISRVYYRNSHAAFIVCDNTNPETLENVKKWKSQIGEKTLLPNGKPLPVILLVNKCDITENPLSEEAITTVCKECGITTWFRTSAKTGENITECMTRLLDSVIVFDDIWEVEMTDDAVTPSTETRSKKGCC
ncbi:RAS-related protein RAB [Blastocystis sp. subtype 4]|uniref:RAS-related protein RAB n=1 Tax=Blastocystis sp. subtype 4 TaxID=944170 RepID=UPI0007116657|nr:RAS-related protein RAB [Blastocystis sp. subtype 4]KNB42923.1 RAS-related protein RAB [Blastocystis sp. subtype 4]|eukprot:XP_014526366.1 RAS-related protein RAB [Blastocystis sp. subtype 4]